MGEFFGKEFHGQPFQLFGPAHLTALGIILLINLTLLWRGRRLGAKARLAIRYGLAALLIVDEALWHLWNWTTGQWSIQNTLPLHLCSMLVFLSAIMLVSKNYTLYEFAYFMGIAGASQALLTPDAGIYGFPHFRAFQVMISHGSIVTAAIYMTAVEGFRPYPRSLPRVFFWMNVDMVIIGFINATIGSNYLFIAHKPETPSLLDVLGPWPWYLLMIEILGLCLCLLLYAPFAWSDLRARQEHKRLT